MISQLKPPNVKVLSLTTIASPHRGSAFADYVLDRIGRELYPFIPTLLTIPLITPNSPLPPTILLHSARSPDRDRRLQPAHSPLHERGIQSQNPRP